MIEDKHFFNKYNNYFRDDESYDLLFDYVKKKQNQKDEDFKDFIVEKGRLYYKKDNVKLEVIKKSDKKNHIKEIVETIGVGTGINKLFQIIKEFFIGISQSDLKKYLRGDSKYQITQPLNPDGKNNMSVFNRPLELTQADHIYVDTDKKYKYILTFIDHFSKMSWAEPQTSLTSKSTIDSFSKILSRIGKKPYLLQVDNGIYKDKKIQEFMKEKGIKFRPSRPSKPTDNGLVERFNRTLRTKIQAGYVRHNKKEWVKYLQDYIDNYNNTIHTTTKKKPIDVFNNTDKKMRKEVRDNTKRTSKVKKNIKFEVGSWVRVSLPSYYNYIKAIEKSKLEKKKLVVNWTPQKFKIIKILKSKKGDFKNWRYLLEDENGKTLQKNQENVYFFGTDLKLTEDYNTEDSKKGVFSYSGVKNYAVRFNPKKEKAPREDERITNKEDINITPKTLTKIVNDLVSKTISTRKKEKEKEKELEKVEFDYEDKVEYIYKKQRYTGEIVYIDAKNVYVNTDGFGEDGTKIPKTNKSLKIIKKKRYVRKKEK